MASGRLQHRSPAEERAHLRAEVEALQRERDDLARELNAVRSEIGPLRGQAAAAAGAAETASLALSAREAAEAEAARLTQELASRSATEDRLKNEVENVRLELASTHQALENSGADLAAKTKELEEVRAECTAAKNASIEAEAALKEVKEGAKQRAEEAGKQRSLALAEAMAARKEAEDRANALEKETKRLSSVVDIASAKADRCDAAEAECSRLRATMEARASAEDKLAEQKARFEAESEELRKQVAVLQQAQASAEDKFAEQRARLEAEAVDLRKQVAALQQARDTADNKFAKETATLEEEAAELRRQVAALQQARATADHTLAEEKATLEKEASELREQVAVLRERLAASENEVELAGVRFGELQKQACDANAAATAATAAHEEADELRSAAMATAVELAELRKQRAALQEELRIAYERAEEAEGNFADADGQRRAFQGEVRELKEQLFRRRLEADAQLLVIHDKDREQKRLRTELEDRTTEAVERQLRIALASEPAPSRPETPRGCMSNAKPSNCGRVPMPLGPAPAKQRPQPPVVAKRASRGPSSARGLENSASGMAKIRMRTPSTATPSDTETYG